MNQEQEQELALQETEQEIDPGPPVQIDPVMPAGADLSMYDERGAILFTFNGSLTDVPGLIGNNGTIGAVEGEYDGRFYWVNTETSQVSPRPTIVPSWPISIPEGGSIVLDGVPTGSTLTLDGERVKGEDGVTDYELTDGEAVRFDMAGVYQVVIEAPFPHLWLSFTLEVTP